jgi:hypothetical protein
MTQPTNLAHLQSSKRLIERRALRRRPRELAVSLALTRWFCRCDGAELHCALRQSHLSVNQIRESRS